MVKRKTGIDVEVQAMTAAAAEKAYPGTAARQISRMCLKGERLRKLYGSDIPVNELNKVLFGKRVGKYWYISKHELDRIFLPSDSATLKG